MALQTKQEEFIFRSKLPDIYIPKHLPLHSYCFENISDVGSRPCLINGSTGEVHTYYDVELKARKVASGLNKLGIGKADVVLLLLPNTPEFVFVFLGASHLGAITTAANPFFTPAEIAKQAKGSNAKLIITQASYYDKVKDLASENNGVKIICIDSPPQDCLHFSELTKADEHDIPQVNISPDDVVALPYSSGTTGLPKGVMLTHKGLVTSVAQQVDGENPNLYFHKEDVILCVLPLFHIYSLNSVLLCGLRVGAAILIMQKFEIVSLLELIQKHKVSVIPIVPPIVLAISKSPDLHKYDLSSIRILKSGGAPLGKELEETVGAKFPNAKFGQVWGCYFVIILLLSLFAFFNVNNFVFIINLSQLVIVLVWNNINFSHHFTPTIPAINLNMFIMNNIIQSKVEMTLSYFKSTQLLIVTYSKVCIAFYPHIR